MYARICKPLAALMTVVLLASTLLAGDKALEAKAPDAPAATKQPDYDILGALKAEGNFKITLAALEDTELSATFQKKGPYTFFAPTDEAYQRVPKLAALLNDTPTLKSVLSRHIVLDRKIMMAELAKEKTILTMSGETVAVSSDGKRVQDGTITAGDIAARNGVIHAVDHVFMEENDSALRGAGYTLEQGVKSGARKVYDGLKTGANKIKEAFSDNKKTDETTGEKTEGPPQEEAAKSDATPTEEGGAK
mgnify:CR=1 FL=1